MTLALAKIEKRLVQLEYSQPTGLVRVHSLDFEKYEDFLVEAKKARILLEQRRAEGKYISCACEVVAIDIVPQADELRACLHRMEAAGMDEALIEHVRQQLHIREEEKRRYLESENWESYQEEESDIVV